MPIAQVRYATGCLLPKTTLENAQKIQEHLKSLGIASFLVPYSLSFWKTRPYLVNSLSLSPEGARTPQMHFRWEQLKLLSYGVLGHSVSAAHLLQHPRFQQLCDFSSEEMKSALKNKIIEASFENFSIEEEKKRSQSYLDLLFEEPFSYLRISRRDFHYPQRESSTQLSSLYNLHELLSQCIQWVPHVQKTPSTEEFLANPLQAQTFFEGEEHLLNYSRWFFQKSKVLAGTPRIFGVCSLTFSGSRRSSETCCPSREQSREQSPNDSLFIPRT
jgi:hypothetical protein